MNLTSLFEKDAALRDAALNDLSWMENSGLARKEDPYLDIENVKNPNNIKPQLEMEWGLGGPDIDINEPAGVVKRNVPEDSEGDAGGVIVFARDMQNRGFRASQIIKSLKAKFNKETLAKAASGLREQFCLDGIVGRIAIDGRGYDSCQQALKASMNSPYKRFIKYVIGCECGDPHMLPFDEKGMFVDMDSSGNAVDDFFASTGEPKVAKQMVSHCRTSMLKIMAAQGDLDDSEMDSTLIEMMNTTGIPAGTVASVRKQHVSNVQKIRNAFRLLDIHRDSMESKKYSGSVNSDEFKIKRADNEIEFGMEPMTDLDVDPVNYSLQQEVEPEDYAPTNFEGPNSLPSVFSDVSMDEEYDMSQVPVEMTDERNPEELDLFDINPSPPCPIDERPAELGIEFGESEPFELEMDQNLEEEFIDSDVIDFEEELDRETDLDVDMRQDMVI